MIWDHFKTILWLRWRLSRNQLTRGGGLALVLRAISTVIGCVAGVAAFVGGFFGGYLGFSKASPSQMLVGWDVVVGVFLFFWLIGMVSELQRSEMIDLHALMRFPVSLKEVFLINFAASHFTFGLIVCSSFILGLILGLAFGKSILMLLLLLPAFGLIFMITAWTYCLRGWLASLMANQRRRRAIVVGISAVFFLVSQLPNFYFNVLSHGRPRPHRRGQNSNAGVEAALRNSRDASPEWLLAHQIVPVLWLPKGAMALAEANPLPALLGALGTIGIGGLGIRRAYRTALLFYRGATEKSSNAPVKQKVRVPGEEAANSMERKLFKLPEEAAAMFLNTYHSMWRAPEVKLGLMASMGTMALMGSMLLIRGGSRLPEPFKPLMVAGAASFVLFSLTQMMFNQFGFDRDGFRGLVLCPASRKHILLGKNLAFAPLAFTAGLLLLGMVMLVVRVSILTAVSGVFQLVTAYCLACMWGNLASILAPYRIAPGSLKPTKPPIQVVFILFLAHILFPILMLPVFVPPLIELLITKFVPGTLVPVNFILSTAITGAFVCSYWFSLAAFGRLLQRRETHVLRVVTHDTE